MATITISNTFTLPENMTATEAARLISDEWGYKTTILDQPNPESRVQFIKRVQSDRIKHALRSRRKTEQIAALDPIPDDVTSD